MQLSPGARRNTISGGEKGTPDSNPLAKQSGNDLDEATKGVMRAN